MFFKAVQKIRETNKDFSYILECAGGNNETIIETASKYGEEDNVENRGFIPRQEALDMQAKADILLAPDIESGNILYKSLVFFSNTKNAGVIVGAKAPIILTSRADSEETKLNSIALGVLMAAKASR
jgi:glycosyltransferase involved in cell wall biosynthesis